MPNALLLALLAIVALTSTATNLGCAAQRPARQAPAQKRAVPTPEPVRRPASDTERAKYAEREQAAQGLEEFEGGQRVELTTILIIVLIVLIVIIII
jgi:hypothetical protein